MRPERRVRVFTLSEENLLGILTGQLVVGQQSFPEGVKMERCWHDNLMMGFHVMVSHPSFEAVPEGDLAPYHSDIKLMRVERG